MNKIMINPLYFIDFFPCKCMKLLIKTNKIEGNKHLDMSYVYNKSNKNIPIPC